MPDSTNIGSLEVTLTAEASKANKALSDLYKDLGLVGSALRGINAGSMASLSNGISQLEKAMKGMQTISKVDYNRLASGIEKISRINTKGLYSSAAALNAFNHSISGMQVNNSAVQIAEVANSVSRLGYKTTDKAIENIPRLTTALDNMIRTMAKAPAISSNIVNFTTALGNLGRSGNASIFAGMSTSTKTSSIGIGNLSKSLRGLSINMSSARKNGAGLASVFGMFYAKCFLLIRGVKQLGAAIESSMDYVETFNYFDVTMKKIGKDYATQYNRFGYDSAESYADSFEKRLNELTKKMTGYNVGDVGELTFSNEKNLGLDPNEIMNFQARIGALTNSVGMIGEASTIASKALTMLSADLSSLTNTDLSSVMNNLASGLMGQSRALYKYGIDITNASLSQYALNLGIEKSVTEMSQSEKMQLRLLAILDQSKIAWADQINTINTAANQYRVLSQQTSNLGRVIGNLFLPIVEKVLPVVNGMTIALNKLFTTLGFKLWGDNWLTNIMGGISGGAGSASEDLGDLEDGLDGVTDGIGSTNKAAKELKRTLLGFDEMNVLNDNSDSSSSKGSGSGSAIDLTDQINAALADYEKTWNDAFSSMENNAQKYANIIEKAFKPISDLLSAHEWENAGVAIGNLLTHGLSKIDSYIEWGNVRGGVTKAIDAFTDIINGIVKGIDWSKTGKLFGDGITTISKSLNRIWQGIDWDNLGRSLAEHFNSLTDYTDWESIGVTFTNKLAALRDLLYGYFTDLDWRKAGKALGDSLNSAVKNINFKKVGATLAAGVSGLASSIQSFAKEVDWLKIGSDIGSGLASIDWIGAATTVVSSLLQAFYKAWLGFNTQFAGTMEGFLINAIVKIKVTNAAGSLANKFLTMVQGLNLSGSMSELAGKISGGIAAALKFAPIIAVAAAAIEGLISEAVASAKQSRELREIDVFGDTIDNLVQKTKDAADEIEQNIKRITSSGNADYLAESNQIKDLAGMYEDLSKKTGLSAGEKDKLRSVSEQLIELIPELSSYYDEENGYLDIQAGKLDEIIAANDKKLRQKAYEDILVKLYQEQAQAIIDQKEAQDNLNAAWDNYNDLIDQFEKSDSPAEIGQLGNQAREAKDGIDKLQEAVDIANGKVEDCNQTISEYSDLLYGATDAQDDFAENAKTTGQEAKNGMTAPLSDGARQIERTMSSVVRSTDKSAAMRQNGRNSSSGWISGFNGIDYDSSLKTKMARVISRLNITGDARGVASNVGTTYANTVASTSYNDRTLGGAANNILAKFNISSQMASLGANAGTQYVANMDAAISKAKRTSVNTKNLIIRANAGGGIFSGGQWKPVTEYGDGGYPGSAQLFVARERGAELVGTIGNHTAVMNNDQIVASVSAGVANAVAAVMQAYGGNGGSVNVVLQGDAKKLFRAMQSQARDYQNQTGNPAFG